MRAPTSISRIRPCIKIAVTLTILAVCPTIEAASDRWNLSVTGMPSPPLQMRAIFSADDGDLVFNLGTFSAEGDFRVDNKGRNVTVGDETVELTPGVATTIFLSGDKSEGEPLRLDRVQTVEES